MSGVKGRSGGARKGTGGARPGAGRPKNGAPTKSAKAAVRVELEPQPNGGALKRSKAESVQIDGDDTLKLLQDVAFGRVDATALQVRAAIAAVQYTHVKKGDGGIKEGKQDAAKKASAGKFSPSAPPKLVVNNR